MQAIECKTTKYRFRINLKCMNLHYNYAEYWILSKEEEKAKPCVLMEDSSFSFECIINYYYYSTIFATDLAVICAPRRVVPCTQ